MNENIQKALQTGDVSNLNPDDTVALLEGLSKLSKGDFSSEDIDAPDLSEEPVKRSVVVKLLVAMVPQNRLQVGGSVLSVGAGAAGTGFLISKGTPIGWALLPILGAVAAVTAGNMLFNYKPERDDKIAQVAGETAYKVFHPIDTYRHWKQRRHDEKQCETAAETVGDIAKNVMAGIQQELAACHGDDLLSAPEPVMV